MALRARDALLDAMIPGGTGALPGLDAQPAARRQAFWERFDHAAPWSLRLALHLAAGGVVGLGPWLTGAERSWARLDGGERDRVLHRVGATEAGAAALDLARLVACMCWFHQDEVQDHLRAGPMP